MTRLDICNRALAYLGEDEEKRLSRNSENGRLCLAHYHSAAREVLSYEAWSFALETAGLTEADVETMPWGKAYSLPGDSARPLALVSGEAFLIRGGLLWTREPRPVLSYVKDMAGESDSEDLAFSPEAARAVSARLAYYLAPALSPGLLSFLSSEADRTLSAARLADAKGRESEPPTEKGWAD